jgi:hypothetical protein
MPRRDCGRRRRSGRWHWHTSIFPDAKTHTHLLPAKKSIRIAEQLHPGDVVDVELEIEN